ncbi:DUF3995 domain-containing protein [Ilumatobacter coccineus]|uniref:DUF3995 domain-containing protein n=1 Tax=Ilumatobacter coccineus TaxID=467094 RepID=UPI000A0336BC|nr:DUF3995 domain-containing protein [Ilumatobacter coccineus]
MNIRNRMESVAVGFTVAGLGAAGALHALWASGSTWPRDSSDELADLVVGTRPFPSPPATWAVTGLVAGGAWLVLAADGRVPAPISVRLTRLGAAGVAGALALRGAGGLVAGATRLIDVTDEFRRWDLRVYSPLCLALAAGAAVAARPTKVPPSSA